MQVHDGRIVAPLPYGALPQDSHATVPRGGRQHRGAGKINVVLPTIVEVIGVSIGWVHGKGAQPRKNQR